MRFLLTTSLLALTATVTATATQAQSVELYGGTIVAPSQLDYGPMPSNPPTIAWDMDNGIVAGGGLYWSIPGLANAELGLDAMVTNRDYTGLGWSTSTQSVMAAGRMAFPTNVGITPYVGLGLGAINVNFQDPGSPFLNGSDLLAGYQAELGIRYQLGNVGTFMALKYQSTFGDPVIQMEYVEYESLSLIAGVRW